MLVEGEQNLKDYETHISHIYRTDIKKGLELRSYKLTVENRIEYFNLIKYCLSKKIDVPTFANRFFILSRRDPEAFKFVERNLSTFFTDVKSQKLEVVIEMLFGICNAIFEGELLFPEFPEKESMKAL